MQKRTSQRERRGASAAEFAVILPLVMLLIFGGIELGRAVMVQHVLDEVARGATRMYAVTTELTEQDVRNYVTDAMNDANLPTYTITFDPTTTTDVGQMDPMSVSISVRYNDVAILPAPWFMGGKTLAGICVMPADTGQLSSSRTATNR